MSMTSDSRATEVGGVDQRAEAQAAEAEAQAAEATAQDRPARDAPRERPASVLRVAILGAGTVGREVIRALTSWPIRPGAADGARLELVGVAVRNPDRIRGLGLHPDLVVDDPAALVSSPDVDVVVELIGGEEPAHGLIAGALSDGKSVVTANKHVVAHHGASLEAQSRRTGAALRFEAAVAGGIPILGPLAADLSANRITHVRGIINGTTNFILTAMGEEGRGYDEVLAAAQAAGYAEADPRGDVEGDDAVNKLVILARLAFGGWIDPRAIARRPPSLRGAGRPGITGVTLDEIRAAEKLGLRLKLVAEAAVGNAATVIYAAVTPRAVPVGSRLGQTGGVQNRIEIDGEPVGTVGFDGPGAGGGASSSAVLGDLVALARGGVSTWAGLPVARPSPVRPIVRLPAPEQGGFGGGGGGRAAGTARRRWFLVLPGVARAQLPRTVRGEVVEIEGGLALRTEPLRLGDVIAALESVVDAELDPTIYAADD